MTEPRPGPLAGVRVLEATHVLAGPYCGMLLADLGADVIKIESPAGGDMGRTMGPHHIGRHNVYFASLNRNKRSVCLDLGTPAGQAALGRLAADSHALVTNLRPDAVRRLGLTYESLRRHNERIVCVALTGYGLDGPGAGRPAYDYVIQAATGVMAMAGDPGGPPVKAGYSAVDNSAGVFAALGLVAKVLEGKGGQLDVSMYDTMVSQLNYLAAAYLNAGQRPRRLAGGAHPYIVPAQLFETRDGHVALFITHDDFWRRFAGEVGRPDWIADPRMATMAARGANREPVVAAVAEVLKGETTARWIARLAPLGIVIEGVETLDHALESELARARGTVVETRTSDGPIRMVANPIKIAGEATRYDPPPLLGEHTAEVLGGDPPP